VLGGELGEPTGGLSGLSATGVVQRHIGLSLESPLDVEVGLTMAPEQDGLRHSSASGSGRFRSMTGTSFHSRSSA
jgi:hypothetical protein